MATDATRGWTVKVIDLYLRTGFHRPRQVAPTAWRDEFAPVAAVHAYPVEEPFTVLAAEIARGEAPYILLADDAVELPAPGGERLVRFLGRNHCVPALTLTCEALVELLGSRWEEPRLGSVEQSLRELDRLPSWFCVLNRQLVAANGLLEVPYDTLEFFLVDAARRLRAHGVPMLCHRVGVGFDARLWVRDLVERNSAALCADYQRFRSLHPDSDEVPRQFRIERVGEYVSLPGPPPAQALAAESPLFSVICPAYKPAFFEGMLQSVLGQSWQDWELLVLVDGPPASDLAALRATLESCSDPRLRWQVQENLGTGPTRRLLVEMARGRYVLSIDDDDLLFTDTLEVFAGAIAAHPDVEVFRGGAQLIGLVNRYLFPRSRLIIDGISVDTFEVTQPFVLERGLLARLGGFEGDDGIGGAGEDTDFFLKVDRERPKTAILNRPLYYRRLSTFNQSLSFVLPDAVNHLWFIDRRHTPSDWLLSERLDEDVGRFTSSILTYTHLATGCKVLAPTRYFSYQTVGDTADRPIDLEITSVCNADCPFCPREVLAGKNEHMPLELVHSLAEHLRRERGGRRVILCGIGESTLHPHLEDVVEVLTEAGAEVCMTTNGARLPPDRFEELAARGLREINFSLNAATAETHEQVMSLKSFDTVVAHLEEILAERLQHHPDVEIHVSFVLCNLNQHEVRAFVERWRGTAVAGIWLHPVNNRAGLLSPRVQAVDLRPYESEYAQDPRVVVDLFRHDAADGNVCKIALGIDFFSSDGSMRLCAMDYRRKTFFGNLQHESPQSMHLDKILSYLRGDTRDLCARCDFCPPGATVAAAPSRSAAARALPVLVDPRPAAAARA